MIGTTVLYMTYTTSDLEDIVGKRVEIGAHTDRWMRGDRFATIVSNEGMQGMVLLYKLRFDRSGDVKTYADCHFRVLPRLTDEHN